MRRWMLQYPTEFIVEQQTAEMFPVYFGLTIENLISYIFTSPDVIDLDSQTAVFYSTGLLISSFFLGQSFFLSLAPKRFPS